MSNLSQNPDYINRIGLVMNHIERHLDQKLRLHDLAEIACFSPFHFHRIFSALTGETLQQYINRKRIERTAALMISGTSLSFQEMSDVFGFGNQSAFSRAFKKYYGLSPTAFKAQSQGANSRIDHEHTGPELKFKQYVQKAETLVAWTQKRGRITVKEINGFNLAGIQHTGPFNAISEAYGKLLQWAGPKQLLDAPQMVTVIHDDPKVTQQAQVRQTACIVTEKAIKSDGKVIPLSIESGRYAIGQFTVDTSEFETAWNAMCLWVPQNGYETGNGQYFERYRNDNRQHPEQKFIVDICIPVK